MHTHVYTRTHNAHSSLYACLEKENKKKKEERNCWNSYGRRDEIEFEVLHTAGIIRDGDTHCSMITWIKLVRRVTVIEQISMLRARSRHVTNRASSIIIIIIVIIVGARE